MMRIPLTLTLFEKSAPEDNELQISWDVRVSVDLTWDPPTREWAGELLTEDFRIEEVTAVWMTYGTQGSVIVPLDTDTRFGRREGHRTLEWLQSQLPDRDDWLELMSSKAIERAPEYLPHAPRRRITRVTKPCLTC